MAAKDPTFAAFLSDPTQTKLAKRKGITALLEEGKFSDITKNFFCESQPSTCVKLAPVCSPCDSLWPLFPLSSAVLADNGRLGETRHIAEKYEELLMASRGEVKGQVTSAEVRENAQRKNRRDAGWPKSSIHTLHTGDVCLSFSRR